MILAYVLWFFFLHYFYFGRIGLGVLFILTGGGFLIWWLIDAYRTQAMVKEHNRDAAIETLRNLKAITA
jgi:TM2 domain-containing membrane protein YozV